MSLNWKTRETRDGDVSTAFYAGMKLVVIDRDGDGASWSLEEGDKLLASGSGDCCGDNLPDYMEHARGIAEEAARIIGRHRKALEATAEKTGQRWCERQRVMCRSDECRGDNCYVATGLREEDVGDL